MIRTAILFAIWTIVCMAIAIVGFFAISDLIDGEKILFSDDNPSIRAAGFLLMFSPVAGIVAGLLWMLFHRKEHRPSWWGYVLLALLVVLISHMLVFGVIMISGADGLTDTLVGLVGALTMLLVHGWLSVPVAIIGTALFVLGRRKLAR
jgi:hypothetical protein